jgi:hypothetical protein
MPHYYFHIDGKSSHRDTNGEDFDAIRKPGRLQSGLNLRAILSLEKSGWRS